MISPVDFAPKTSLRRIVSEKICEIVCGDDVVYRCDFVSVVQKSLFNDRAKNQPSDASEAIDADCSHVRVWGRCSSTS